MKPTRSLAIASVLVLLAFAVHAQSESPKPAPSIPAASPATPAAEPTTQAAAPADAAPGNARVTLDLQNVTVREVVEAIVAQTGWSLIVTAPESVDSQRISVRVKDMPVDDLLSTVVGPSDLVVKRSGNTLVVSESKHRHHRAPHGADHQATIKLDLGHTVKVDVGDEDEEAGDDSDHDGASDERVNVGGSTTIEAHETVSEAVAVGGALTIRGHVEGDAVAVGGWVKLEPGAVVDGDAVSVGGSVSAAADTVISGDAVAMGGVVETQPGAVIGGNRVQLGGRIGAIIAGLVGLGQGAPFAYRAASALLSATAFFVMSVLVVTFLPARVVIVRTFLSQRPGISALGGGALIVGFLPVCLLLAITVIGIPLIPVALAALVLLYVLGLTALASWIGERIPLFEDRKSPVVVMLLGFAVVLLVKLVPFLGSAFVLVATTIAAGAALLSRFGQTPSLPPSQPSMPPASTPDEPQLSA